MPRILLLLLLSSLWAPSWAAGVHWLCGQSDDLTRIVCVADVDDILAAELQRTTATVRGTRFPLDARGTYTVDMWSPATDSAWVEELARATICFRSPGCELTFSAPMSLPDRHRVASLR